ncbi:MAG: hypothetical protein HYY43_02750 [Deltaproteobacteria bacterium]|nr:hypothetical protein [Deltaproteobacteria bacterium]MBI2974493.1 hypothetical protein [Deltaproteobacteria bacterium]
MSPAQRVLIAIELTRVVKEIAIKGIMDSGDVSYLKARKLLHERLMK